MLFKDFYLSIGSSIDRMGMRLCDAHFNFRKKLHKTNLYSLGFISSRSENSYAIAIKSPHT